MKAKFLTLNLKDFAKGLIVAILTGILTALTVPDPTFKSIGIASLIALISYLIKNLATNSEGDILTPEPK